MASHDLTQVQSATIALSGTVSDAFAVSRAGISGIWFPSVTSAQFYLKNAYDTTSANYLPVLKTDASTTFVLTVGVGSCFVPCHDILFPLSNVKLVSEVAQAAVRDIKIVTKL
jgi:hypothetical protein